MEDEVVEQVIRDDALEQTNGFGTCEGSWVCSVSWLCTAAEPAADTCDYTDNDCDGLTDEDFRADGGAFDDALRQCRALSRAWLDWLLVENGGRIPPAIRFDFVVRRTGPGTADARTLELCEQGFSWLRDETLPPKVFAAVARSASVAAARSVLASSPKKGTKTPPLKGASMRAAPSTNAASANASAPVSSFQRTYTRPSRPSAPLPVSEAYSYYFFHYRDTPLLVVNTDDIDFVNNPADFDAFVDQIMRPAETPLPKGSPISRIEINYPAHGITFDVANRVWLMFLVAIVFAFVIKDRMGVKI